MSAAAAIFCRPSCTLFSPKSRCPAAYGRRGRASTRIGLRDRDQPDVRRRRARPAPAARGDPLAHDLGRAAPRSSLGDRAHAGRRLELRQHRLGLAGELAGRARATGTSRTPPTASGILPSLSSAMPSWKCASAWFGLALSASSNLTLASAILPCVPQDDALVVDGVGAAAAGAAAARLGAHRRRFVEALLVVVERGQRVQRLGVVGLELERLLPALLGLLLVLLLQVGVADVVVAVVAVGMRRPAPPVNFSMATSWLPALLAATPSSKVFFSSADLGDRRRAGAGRQSAKLTSAGWPRRTRTLARLRAELVGVAVTL